MRIIITAFVLVSLVLDTVAQKSDVENTIKNFEELWHTFDKHYANFEVKNVNWQSVYDQYRPLITSQTTNKELFDISCKMVQELRDGHVTIVPDFDQDEIECGPPYDFKLEVTFDTDDKLQQFGNVIDATLVDNGFSKPYKCVVSNETNFQFRTSNTLGYLRLDEMTEILTFGKYRRALNQTLKQFIDKEAVIIDLRFNGGGWDFSSYRLASRFIPKGGSLAHFERTKIKGKEAFKEMKIRKVRSRGKIQFTKPIVILTSDFTASAAEVFVLLMKDLPNVTIIGDNTEGIFSDMYEFKLPNKWIVTLSNQQFFSLAKVNYEGVGIEPEIRVLNTLEDLQNGEDSVIEAAIQYLSSKEQ